MGHYSDYYADEKLKKLIRERADLEEAEKKLNDLCFWNSETKYILPDDVRKIMNEEVLRYIRSELYSLDRAIKSYEED